MRIAERGRRQQLAAARPASPSPSRTASAAASLPPSGTARHAARESSRHRQRKPERLGDAGHGADAVPITMQVPTDGARRLVHRLDLARVDLAGADTCAQNRRQSVQAPSTLALVVADHHRPDRQSRSAGRSARDRGHDLRRHASCRSRRSAPPRPSAGRGSSPRCPSPSGCAGTSRSGARSSRGSRWSGTPSAGRRRASRRASPPRSICGTLPWQGL